MYLEEEGKEGIAEAAKPILGNKGSMTGLVNAFGKQLKAEIERVGIKGHERAAFKLKVEIVPNGAVEIT